jgi:excisionase family DNA binding protein
MNEKLLTPEQVAERLQVTERTVYSWLRRGKLPALKLGRLWRIRPDDLETFLENARKMPP